MSVPGCTILVMETKWFKYTWVCTGECDALIEYTMKTGYTPNVTELTCICGSNATLLSVEDATILPTTTKEDKMETMTATYIDTKVAELEEIISRQNSALSTHQNCDYWKAENGRIGRQLIELVNDGLPIHMNQKIF